LIFPLCGKKVLLCRENGLRKLQTYDLEPSYAFGKQTGANVKYATGEK
jgi:hypothetical protein